MLRDLILRLVTVFMAGSVFIGYIFRSCKDDSPGQQSDHADNVKGSGKTAELEVPTLEPESDDYQKPT
jgi:hypothetical protein